MNKKHKNDRKSEDKIKSNSDSKEYTIAELLELGQKYNKVQIAPPIFKEQILHSAKKQE